eukprot:9495960-Lingulodinium_polyedra.AAC.1
MWPAVLRTSGTVSHCVPSRRWRCLVGNKSQAQGSLGFKQRWPNGQSWTPLTSGAVCVARAIWS